MLQELLDTLSSGVTGGCLGGSQVFNDSLAVDKFLGQEASSGKHSKTTVLKLLRLHLKELFWVFRLQAKRIESNVSWDVVITQKTWFVDRDILGLDPADFGTVKLSTGNTDTQDQPEGGVDLSKVGDGGSSDLAVEDESLGLDGFANEEADGGKHGNTSMGKLCLTVSLEGSFIGLLSETKRVEKTSGRDGSWDGVDGKGQWGNVLLCDWSLGEEGSSWGGKKGKSGGDLHVVGWVCLFRDLQRYPKESCEMDTMVGNRYRLKAFRQAKK
mmetsp:Transcript_44778/g.108171  ORF Transcript_44778/g.108171 Transcript_44778/m.108171 type:complete len:270 (-) Transcript_44778:56-865(-)